MLTNRRLIYFGVLSVLIILGTSCRVQKPVSPYQTLVWQDEFATDGAPDSTKWVFSGRGKADWARYCTDSPQTAYVKNGRLYLRGIANRSTADTVRYHTGCIQTKDRFSFKYGKVKVRAKVSEGKGSWPAIWMMPQDAVYGGWPYSGEIDIMEHLNSDTLVYQTLHSEHIDVQKEKEDPIYYTTVPINPGEYNVYGIEWYPERIDFFVNGRKTFTYPKAEGAGSVQWPFDQSFYLILDQALGGSWVGEINEEDLPVQMAVDWVRVYR